MKRFGLAALFLLLSAVASFAQGMAGTDYYVFSQALIGGGTTYYEVVDNVTGYVDCGAMPTCQQAHHYAYGKAQIGPAESDLTTPTFSPPTSVDYSVYTQENTPFMDYDAQLFMEIHCSVQNGVYRADSNGFINNYWEVQITFEEAIPAGDKTLVPDCFYADNGYPDWISDLNNPDPACCTLFQAIQLAYSTSQHPAQGHWSGFIPDCYECGELGSYGIQGWYYNSSGAPGPMPQECTQNQTGRAVFEPGWKARPN